MAPHVAHAACMDIRGGRNYFILTTVAIDAIGFGIIIPVLPRLVMDVGGVSLSEATWIGGWLALSYAAMQFLLGPTIGNLSDRFGRRPVLLASLTGYAIDYLLMGFAPTLLWLFVGRLLAGVFGGSYGACMAALADVTPPERRAKAFGMVGAAFGIGFVIGPAIGGLLGEWGPRVPFFATAALAGLNIILGLLAFPETLPPERRRPFSWRRANPVGALAIIRRVPGLALIVAAYFSWQIASMVYPSIWSYFAAARFGWGPGMIGLSLALVGLVMALSQVLLTGRVVARFGERRAAQIGLAASVSGYTAFALVTSPVLALITLVLLAPGSLVQPSLSAMLSQRMPPDAQGEAQGIGGSVIALGSVIAPLLYNPALAWFTSPAAPFRWPGAPFVIAVGFGLLTFLILTQVPRRAVQMPPATGG